MAKKLPDRLFFILASLVVIFIAFYKLPYFKSKYFSMYRKDLFENFQSELAANQFDAEHYWEFRERFSPGTFLRDERSTDFFSTFRIVSVEEGLTPLFYYESANLRSLDGISSENTEAILAGIKKQFPGEIIQEYENFVLIKVTDTEYVLAFAESIGEMKRVNGMFDYLPAEVALLDNKLWYNATYLKVD